MSDSTRNLELGVGERDIHEQLRPVTDALRQEGEARATALRSDADRDAAAAIADARRRGEELLGTARTQGVADARREGARVVAEARRRARSHVLAAQRELYERVRSLARERLEQLAGTPVATALNDALAVEARARLGSEAVVEVGASGVGIVAVAGRRRLDLSTDALVERELSTFAARIEELWS